MGKREIIDHFGVGLRSCPMCGATEAHDAAEAWTGGVYLREDHRPPMWDGLYPARIMYEVQCNKCGLHISRGTLEAAREAWNKRTAQDQGEEFAGLDVEF